MNIEELNESELKEIKRAFTIFVMKVVKHASYDFMRKETLRNSRNVPLDEDIVNKVSLSNYDDGTFFVENFTKLEKVMSKEKHRKAISKLSKREKQIINLLYIEEKSIEEISRLLNISNKTISNTRNNALNKLRKDMEE